MKQKILMVLCALVGLMMLNGGLDKLFHYMPVPKDIPAVMLAMMKSMMDMGWLLPLVAVAEILGGVLFAIPKFRVIGTLILFPILVGITIIHVGYAPSGLPIVAAIWAIVIWSMFEDKKQYLQLIK
ncbi:MAG: DoxX family membrane protein [Chitinophagaceae bacterium]|nr:DoxX family membrane protein [Chitinophagaceae bacterium]